MRDARAAGARRLLAAMAPLACLAPAALSLAPLALGGCAAALIPLAATGMGARHQLAHGRHGAGHAPQVAAVAAPADPASPAAATPVADLSRLEAVPSDPSRMRPGQVYVGSVAPPGQASAAAPAPEAARAPGAGQAPAPGTPPARGWADVLHYVAGHFAGRGERSAILARGSTLAEPRWVPCGAKPAALLVDLDAVVPPNGGAANGEAAGVLDAAETLEVSVVYLARRGGPALAGALAALKSAGLHAPVPGTTLLAVSAGQEPAARAAAGARYCVVAIAGDRAEDFPNAATPTTAGAAWSPDWFMVPAAAP